MKDSGGHQVLQSLYQGPEKVTAFLAICFSGNKQSGITIPLEALGIRHLNIFADLHLLALGLGSRTLTARWMMIILSLMNEALCAPVDVWHF